MTNNTSNEADFTHQTVNLNSVILGCQGTISAMTHPDDGSISNASSISGLISDHNVAVSNSSKTTVRKLTKLVVLHCTRQ